MAPYLPAFVAATLLLLPAAPPAARPEQPTSHAVLPADASELWLVPSHDRASRAGRLYQPVLDGMRRYTATDYAAALSFFAAPRLAETALADYAAYYAGMSQLRLTRAAEALRTFEGVLQRKPAGYVAIAAALGAAQAHEDLGNHARAVELYARLAADRLAVNDDVLSRLGRAALADGDRKQAAEAYLRIYYEFALTDAALTAASELSSLQDHVVRTGYQSDLGRAAMLFGARRYAEARSAFQELQRQVGGDDRELVELRLAESDFYLKRYAAARDALRPWLERASRKGEAKFFYLSALRELGEDDEYIALTRALVQEFPDSSWSEEALNNLGTYYILNNEDELAARVFSELYEKFPGGSRAERAAWKAGWWSYKNGEYADTIRVFERAAAAFPRSDYRPSFLYWAARSHGKLGAGTQAEARLRLVFSDYGNSYYGRLARRQLSRLAGGAPPAARAVAATSRTASEVPPAPPTEPVISLLLAHGLYDDALNELRYAQRAWGTSTRIDATIAWAYHQKGELRRAISIMRRAYPQFLTSDGGQLPPAILQVIFPLTYWDAIRRHSAARGLDPYLVAALIAQESTFDPGIRSAANAWGLMQIVPATGRRLARSLGIRNFTTASLTNPETNIRLGTLYFSRLVDQFGGTYYALASYNAGENRIVRWKAERPGIEEDEFIDDIPFPETQNYVKRILGTAEDYRLLYEKGGAKPLPIRVDPVFAPAPREPRATATKPAAGKTVTKKRAAKKPAAKKRASRRR
ncbi:MAG: transglycosylase SLT domain-containing protein [Acidobacteria bacterium]|nr:transglycosylase SLT domain-containing protein [Acidobacteriota bacterium]